jgi:hypothetical protein
MGINLRSWNGDPPLTIEVAQEKSIHDIEKYGISKQDSHAKPIPITSLENSTFLQEFSSKS